MIAYKENILVEIIKNENITKSNPQQPERYNPVKGVVIDVGDDVKILNVGDIVYYNRLASTSITDAIAVVPASSVHCFERV